MHIGVVDDHAIAHIINFGLFLYRHTDYDIRVQRWLHNK